jgi:uncharacterized protein YabE (DUF348 family)
MKMDASCIETPARDAAYRLKGLRVSLQAIAIPAAIALAVFAGWRAYAQTATPVALWVDGQSQTILTHATTVGALLEQQGLALTPADVVWPSPDASLAPDSRIIVERARFVMIRADDRTISLQTRAAAPEDILKEAGIALGPEDLVLVNGQPQSTAASASGERALSSRGREGLSANARPTVLEILRAIPFTVSDGGVALEILATAPTVGEALLRAGLHVYEGDSVFPNLGSPLLPGMTVYVIRAVPVEIELDSRVVRTRTQGATVGEALAREGVALMGMDYSDPAPDTPISDGLKIQVVRLRQSFSIEQQPIGYSMLWKPDDSLEIDQRRLLTSGEEGLRKRRVRTVVRDGVVVQSDILDDWVAREPKDQIFAYGTKVVVRELETPNGTIQYWRKIRVLATSYTAATSGKERDHPEFGITFAGWTARKGIVAVDPTVILLRTRMYVPGYGLADVGDTGGAIKGRRIDLCYDEDNLILWKKWVDIYLLAPAPAPDRIRYVLPDWPLESSR